MIGSDRVRKKSISSFRDWVKDKNLLQKGKKMSNQLIKEAQKSGLSITKDKLIDAIKKSSQTTFALSKSPNSKEAIVVVNL